MLKRLLPAVCMSMAFVSQATATREEGQSGGAAARTLVFDVYRDGDLIGEHRTTVVRREDHTEVTIEIDFEVKVAFVTVYRYEHRNREIWRDGRLVSFRSETDNDGEKLSVRGERADGGMRLTVNGGETVIHPAWMPTTYWNPRTVRHDRLVDTQDGDLLEVDIVRAGRETVVARARSVPATRYEMTGDLDLTLWYDDADRWVKLAFEYKDAAFDYVLREPDQPREEEGQWAGQSGSRAPAPASDARSR